MLVAHRASQTSCPYGNNATRVFDNDNNNNNNNNRSKLFLRLDYYHRKCALLWKKILRNKSADNALAMLFDKKNQVNGYFKKLSLNLWACRHVGM